MFDMAVGAVLFIALVRMTDGGTMITVKAAKIARIIPEMINALTRQSRSLHSCAQFYMKFT